VSNLIIFDADSIGDPAGP